MPDPVRLIVWDLPPAAWAAQARGAGPESTPHARAAALARRGIPGAICAVADVAALRAALAGAGTDAVLIDSAAAEGDEATQGETIQALVAALRLPPEQVLLISANAAHLREALQVQPGLQFTDDGVMAGLLDDARLSGFPDPELSRLGAMRAMLRRDAARRAGADEAAFWRGAGLLARFNHDIVGNIEHAAALTHVLDPASRVGEPISPGALAALLATGTAMGGLLCLHDRFGDWGPVGVYVLVERAVRLFGVLPDVAGLGVADWLYDALGRPPLRVRTPATAHLLRDRPPPVAIAAAESLNPGAQATPAARLPALRVRGGWDAEAIAHFLRPVTDQVVVESNGLRPNGLRVRTDHTAMLALALDPPAPGLAEALTALGLKPADCTTALFDDPPPGTALLLAPFGDAEAFVYRHFASQILLPVTLPRVRPVDLTLLEPEELPEDIRTTSAPLLEALRREFEPIGLIPPEQTEATLRRAFARVPAGCLLFVPLMAEYRAAADGKMLTRPTAQALNEAIRRAAAGFARVRVLDGWAGRSGAPDAVATAAVSRDLAAQIASELGRLPVSEPSEPVRPEPAVPPAVALPAPAPAPVAAALTAPAAGRPPARRPSLLARLFGARA